MHAHTEPWVCLHPCWYSGNPVMSHAYTPVFFCKHPRVCQHADNTSWHIGGRVAGWVQERLSEVRGRRVLWLCSKHGVTRVQMKSMKGLVVCLLTCQPLSSSICFILLTAFLLLLSISSTNKLRSYARAYASHCMSLLSPGLCSLQFSSFVFFLFVFPSLSFLFHFACGFNTSIVLFIICTNVPCQSVYTYRCKIQDVISVFSLFADGCLLDITFNIFIICSSEVSKLTWLWHRQCTVIKWTDTVSVQMKKADWLKLFLKKSTILCIL